VPTNPPFQHQGPLSATVPAWIHQFIVQSGNRCPHCKRTRAFESSCLVALDCTCNPAKFDQALCPVDVRLTVECRRCLAASEVTVNVPWALPFGMRQIQADLAGIAVKAEDATHGSNKHA
jgi:hypothetical protein